jgi:hypothetical protein
MTTDNTNAYVDTIANMTNRIKYYGSADVTRISFYKLALKYRDLMRATDIDANGVAMKRVLDILLKKIETECADIQRIK